MTMEHGLVHARLLNVAADPSYSVIISDIQLVSALSALVDGVRRGRGNYVTIENWLRQAGLSSILY